MKHMLVLENNEKSFIENASAIINAYCNEMDDCDECPLDGLCTQIHNSTNELNIRKIFDKVKDIIC